MKLNTVCKKLNLTQCITILVLLVNSSVARSELVNTGYDSFNDPKLDIVFSSGFVIDRASIDDWLFLYDTGTGTGTLSMEASFGVLGSATITDALVTTNSNGSLHVDGIIDYINRGETANFAGDMAVTVEYDFEYDVTIFNFQPIVLQGNSLPGFLMTSSSLAPNLLDFHVTSTLLAIVDNPYPVSSIPIPPTALLFLSGVIGLGFSMRRKQA